MGPCDDKLDHDTNANLGKVIDNSNSNASPTMGLQNGVCHTQQNGIPFSKSHSIQDTGEHGGQSLDQHSLSAPESTGSAPEEGSGESVPDDLPKTLETIKVEKKRILKNIFLMSFCFLLVFSAFVGLMRLQSSLNTDSGLGTITQACMGGTMVISCLAIPKLLISQVGHKWTMAISMSGYILWIAANGYPTWATLVPTAVLVGLCGGPLWIAQASYVTSLGSRWHRMCGEPEKAVISRLFGYFWSVTLLCE